MEGVSRLHVRGRRDALERVVELDRPLIRIGRGVECEVRLLDAVMADVQAMLRRRDDGWWLQPVGPSGRIWRGSSAVEDSTRVPPGEPIRIGGHWLTLEPTAQATPEQVAPKPPQAPTAPERPAERPAPATAAKRPITLTERPKIMPEPRPATPAARPQAAPPAVAGAAARTPISVPPRAPTPAPAPARPPVANGVPRPNVATPPRPTIANNNTPRPAAVGNAPRPAINPGKWAPAAPPAPTRERQPAIDRYLKDRPTPPPRPMPPSPSSAENRRQVAKPAAPRVDRAVPPSVSIPSPELPARAAAPAPPRTSPATPPSRPAPPPIVAPRPAPLVEAPEPATMPSTPAPTPAVFEILSRRPERIPATVAAARPIAAPPSIPTARPPEALARPVPTPKAAERPPAPAKPAFQVEPAAEGPRQAPPLALIPMAALPGPSAEPFLAADLLLDLEVPPIEDEILVDEIAVEVVEVNEAAAGTVGPAIEAPAAEEPAPSIGPAEAAVEPETEAAVDPQAAATAEAPAPIPTEAPAPVPEPALPEPPPKAGRRPEQPEDRRPKPLVSTRREATPARTDEGCWPSAQDILRAWDRAHPRVEVAAKPAKPRRQAAPPAAPSEVVAPATRNWSGFPIVWGSASLAAVVLGGAGVGWAIHRAWEGSQAGIWTTELIVPVDPNAAKPGVRVSGAIDESDPPSQKWWLGSPQRQGQYSAALRVAGTTDPRRIEDANARIQATTQSTPVDASTQWAKQIERSQPAGLPREVAPLLWSAERWFAEKKADEGLKAYRRALTLAAGPQQVEDDPKWDGRPMGRRYFLPREEQVAAVVASLVGQKGLEYARWSEAIPRSSVAWLCVARSLKESGKPEAGEAIDQVIALAVASAPGAMESREVRLAAAAEASALGHDPKKAEDFYLLALQAAPGGPTQRSWWINLAEVYAVLNQENRREQALIRARGPSLSDEITARAAKAQLLLRPTNPGSVISGSTIDPEIRTANHIPGSDNREPATEN